MSRQDFIDGIHKLLGVEVTDLKNGRITFPYKIEVGPRAGETVTLGFEVGDFPLNPPSGLNVTPRLLPINPDGSAGHPTGAIHDRGDFDESGRAWQYWSRPYPDWANASQTVKSYINFIRGLFADLPVPAEVT